MIVDLNKVIKIVEKSFIFGKKVYTFVLGELSIGGRRRKFFLFKSFEFDSLRRIR